MATQQHTQQEFVFDSFKECRKILEEVCSCTKEAAGLSSKTLGRIDLKDEAEHHVNLQINVHLSNAYQYAAMSSYFKCDSIGLEGFRKYFAKYSHLERVWAAKLQDYLAKRGASAHQLPACGIVSDVNL